MSRAATDSITGTGITKVIAAIVILAISCALYLHVALTQEQRNDDSSKSDQSAYMNFATRAHESNLAYTGTRNRMPLYPFVQALFYSPNLDEESFFRQGKQVNIVLSIICLGVLGLVFFLRFSRLFALYSLLAIAFLVFAIKAPYFQAEILFYTLFGLAFIAAVDLMTAPKWYKPVGVGILFAFAQLTKASALPGLLTFVGSCGLMLICHLIGYGLRNGQAKRYIYYATVSLTTFTIVMLPYFLESKEKYGSYTYNVNTTFYMWFESWDEAAEWATIAQPRSAWPSIPDDEIPSLGKYLREHSWEQVIDRIRQGFTQINWSVCYGKYSRYRYGVCSQVGMSLLAVTVALAVVLAKALQNARHGGNGSESADTHADTTKPVYSTSSNDVETYSWKNTLHLVLFVLPLFVIYGLSFAWYMPIVGRVPRTFLTLLIPMFWTVGIVVHAPLIQNLRVSFLRRRISPISVAYFLMLLTVLYEIFQVVTIRASFVDGGN